MATHEDVGTVEEHLRVSDTLPGDDETWKELAEKVIIREDRYKSARSYLFLRS
jgi:hypothetical protein